MAKQYLNQCCFCCTLETGGYVIGWLTIIFGCLGLIGSAILVAGGIAAFNQDNLKDDEKTALTLFIAIFSVYVVFTIIYTIGGILLVLGTKRREHRKIIMMLVIMGIGVVFSFLNLITDATAGTIVSSIIGAIIQVYFLVCIYSLYAKIKNENENLGTYNYNK
ncbi:hypothetical protein PVAND_006139 [Polypedilum vanderplanki]|uniref:Uncharacterized protein n=1 Tax=Polypedilum vanderplanki TaxID=319348 RepID=A0A9J6C395_POLVA|nr:hypothetical protein PVAND_006139 [Polypedilum vanderplanki]